MSGTVKDRDTGGQSTIAEDLVDRLMWWIAGPHSDPPASIAQMPKEEQQIIWAQMEDLAGRKGEGFIRGLAEGIAQHVAARRLANDVNEPTEPD